MPTELTLALRPQARLDLIDVTAHIREIEPDFLRRHQRALYYSYHTTAGYPEQRLCERLGYRRDALEAFFRSFQRLFPPEAGYRHDRLELRTELSEEARRHEPRNADAHLTYIGAGLLPAVCYRHAPDRPVYFVDLDGVYDGHVRTRQTTVVGFDRTERLATRRFAIPMPAHRIASVNLRDHALGFFEQLQEWLSGFDLRHGRLDLLLPAEEQHAALTVNEYETLLMRHDLAEVLRNPFRFMAETGRHALQNPRAVPGKALNYAKYDLVRLANEFIDRLRLNESLVERVLNKFLALPAARFLRMKRGLHLLVAPDATGRPTIRQGRYQSPILIQWERPSRDVREIEVRLYRFE
ncbi:hypothetical protein [Rhodothermus marinus]|jgi:thiamine phosphate synthase YjbQ (UPF0047 family)|uniref:hypothetical protein n=1 Tax=Rhodothermus marinus TaxID=29549 RepID=UPI001D2CF669|nr:hypothetical protein [Rhodothermus marinus]MBO2490554.1 hypothetical protein [Rhodothermus marinus]